jgi:hypothetical protein
VADYRYVGSIHLTRGQFHLTDHRRPTTEIWRCVLEHCIYEHHWGILCLFHPENTIVHRLMDMFDSHFPSCFYDIPSFLVVG